MKLLVSLAASLLLATPVAAQQLVVGLGYADFNDREATDTTELNVEYHFAPFHEVGRWSFAGATVVTLDEEGDAFVGAGVSGVYDFNQHWFAEVSFMPGAYVDGDSRNDLGNTLEFRSLLAVGRRVSEGAAFSLAVQHKSNGGLGDHNPGVNTLSLRYHHFF
ncbi:acyloxyacyl hydrolase [Shimia sp. R10_1]|uniref:acyloxyacyl hydrolase n=1 Tax=Shimia sp. R10_1 TaxID=2821095 RepID=UPI001ADABCE9|nr:acyloxyacyl hydrolase [Shimia sp. R10_1]MBO9475303.1 acyloxyacyl hydrolase [Shimia sp. R10_1]